MLLAIFLSILVSIVLFGIFVFVTNFFVAWKGYKWPKSGHFDGKHFYNIGWSKRDSYHVEWKGTKFSGFLRWILSRKRLKWEKRASIQATPKSSHPDQTFEITFVGHATVLIQIGGINIITDPVWSKRTSPFSFFWPKRYVAPGVAFSHLPKIDIVLLSHNHYDHMDIPTLKKLAARDNPIIYTGLWNKDYLNKYHIRNVIDMDWWKTEIIDRIRDGVITFVPAQHFSARGITDRNKTLWWGFIVTIWGKSLYFAGDTGYGAFVQDIKKKIKTSLDVWLLPIGAYKPRWFMADIHTSPEEALRMQKDLGISTAIWIHYGTFPLADDSQDDPLEDLKKAKEAHEYQALDFRVGPNGTVWNI